MTKKEAGEAEVEAEAEVEVEVGIQVTREDDQTMRTVRAMPVKKQKRKNQRKYVVYRRVHRCIRCTGHPNGIFWVENILECFVKCNCILSVFTKYNF